MKSESELLDDLKQLTAGLLFMSETDQPFQVIDLGPQTEITPEQLRSLTAGAGAHTPVTTQSLADFFRAATATPAWKQGAELETARRYQRLVRWLPENLTELQVYRVGEIDVTVYILGRSNAGHLLGLSTRVVET